MSILSDISVSEDMETEVDRTAMPRMFESDVYDMVIDTAYIDSSASGAVNVNYVFKSQDGRELRQTVYITSGEAKGRLPYYVRDGRKIPLPGFNIANAISLLTIGKQVNELTTETKVLSLYNYDEKKNTPQQKEVIMDLLGQQITLGVQQVIEDKRVKNDKGDYVPSGETRTINEIDKVFRHKDKLTTSEIRASKTEPEFYNTWAEANKGKVRDKTQAKKGAVKPEAKKEEAKPAASSLFGG